MQIEHLKTELQVCRYFSNSRTFLFLVLSFYNSLLKITLMHISLVCNKLLVQTDFANTSFPFIKKMSPKSCVCQYFSDTLWKVSVRDISRYDAVISRKKWKKKKETKHRKCKKLDTLTMVLLEYFRICTHVCSRAFIFRATRYHSIVQFEIRDCTLGKLRRINFIISFAKLCMQSTLYVIFIRHLSQVVKSQK